MSAERTLPSARQTTRGRTTRVSGAVCGLAISLSVSCGWGPTEALVNSRTAPDGHRIAVVLLARCSSAPCEILGVGPDVDHVQPITTLTDTKERCSQITWSADGKRVGFLINGQQLRLYDAESRRPAGQFDLVPRDADPPTREARGVTFSQNGAAITFDDCPRDRSGCRPGIMGLR